MIILSPSEAAVCSTAAPLCHLTCCGHKPSKLLFLERVQDDSFRLKERRGLFFFTSLVGERLGEEQVLCLVIVHISEEGSELLRQTGPSLLSSLVMSSPSPSRCLCQGRLFVFVLSLCTEFALKI